MPPPANPAAQIQEALWHLNSGRTATAITACEAILRKNPQDFEALTLLGMAFLSLGRHPDCRRASEKARDLRPRDPRPHHQIATSLLQEGRFDDVDRALERGFRECGRHPILVAARAERLVTTADYEEAYQVCKPLIDAGSLDAHLISAAGQACLRTGRLDEGIALLRACLDSGIHPMARSALLYTLSEALDDSGDHDGAFVALNEANGLKNVPPDLEDQSREMDRYIAAWSREAALAVPRGAPTDLPVFIVGFWRSGTTLIEQTLSSHPQVFGGGEMTLLMRFAHEKRPGPDGPGPSLVSDPAGIGRGAIDRFSRAYLAHLKKLAPGAARVTDKLPPNFMYLGLIAALFPGARVIHCLRDPVDTCVSCYFNMRGGLSYTHDLRALGSFYRDYKRLMAHWKSVLDLPILDVSYEGFVADQETNARKVVEFLGLPWDDRCLRPHENKRVALTRSIHQVRKPVYGSSVQRWRRYERHLGPLFEALGDEIGSPPGGAPAARP
jgi:hypothetical protein